MNELSLKAGWNVLKLGDFVENVRKSGQPTEADSRRYIGLEHLDSGSLRIKRWGSDADIKGKKLVIRKGDLLFAKRNAYLRRVAIAPHDGFFSAHGMVLRPKGKSILPEFLPFFLQSDMFMTRAIEISVGSLSPTINWKAMRIQEFRLPPIEEQKRISEILWAADGAAEGYEVSLDKFSVLKTQILRESLRHSSAESQQCVELYSQPPKNGYSPKTNGTGRGAPTLSIGAVRNGHVNPTGNTKFAEISPEKLDKFRLREGDIVVVRGNGNKSLCGKAGLVSLVPDNCFYPDLLIRIVFDKKKVLPEFALAQWNDPIVHAELLVLAKTTNGIWKINGKDLRQHRLLVPSIDVQNEFVQKQRQLNEREKKLTQHVDSIREVQHRIQNGTIGTSTHV
jgi:type I restriction enzyme, S subunit